MATKKIDKPEVKRGQVWRDMDRRQPGRWLVVGSVDDGVATCRVHQRNRFLDDMVADTCRTTRVRVDRFRPTATGYELVACVGDDGAQS